MLYGQIAWQIGSRVEPVSSGRASSILAVLASRRSDWTPASRFLDEVWDTWPRSGENAVQRHISALRTHLRKIGVEDQVIETSTNGYRLAPWVSTDLGAIEEALRVGEIDTNGSSNWSGPWWWAEPLPGLSWDHHKALRATLTSCANQARKSWVADAIDGHRTAEAAQLLGPMLVRSPDDIELLHLVADIAVASTDRELGQTLGLTLAAAIEQAETQDESVQARLLQLNEIQSSLRPDGYQQLDSVAHGWLHNDLDHSFGSLESVTDSFSQDVIRRVGRCLTWISTDDPWARLMWTELVGLPPVMAQLAERYLISLDAFALEHNRDALRTCEQEVADASGVLELVRALRVRFMVGLGRPIDARQIETVKHLASIDDPAARIEALRFSGILCVKRGELDQARILFRRSVELRRQTSSVVFEDFGHMAEVVISMRDRRSEANNLGDSPTPHSLFPLTTTHATVEMATLWKLLTQPAKPWTTADEGMLHRVLRATTSECCCAFHLLFELRSERSASHGSEELTEEARSLFDNIQDVPSHRHRQATLFALSRYAISRNDRDMAHELHQLLLPWSGEQMGIWPLDVLIGPAADLIHKLEAVFGS